ncbi:hypothetical protein B0A49_01297 [Cryomyces minteri]|uniref:Deacetylase sirtuin-type domain-containing protein n=1 Tax=Cryomyces minteri TaxID=331657 RepID=A0A4U0XIC2_9PEZI|nr:hypothetical protein B0A49_01297 [Cryomyces minteri]
MAIVTLHQRSSCGTEASTFQEALDVASQDKEQRAVSMPELRPDAFQNGHQKVDESYGLDEDAESLYEDVLDDVHEFQYIPGPDTCDPEEAQNFRARLHEIGAERFVYETVTKGRITAKRLCTAFGIRLPKFLEGEPDDAYYPLLGAAITRELSKRCKLPQYNTIDDAAALLEKSRKIIVITGAGISTSLGIPDFRSKHTGFYSKLREVGFSEPEEAFDLQHFDDDPSDFYKLAGDILPTLDIWSPTHEFVGLLNQKSKLLTNYTQNIDNLESNAGIPPEKLIQCHGSWATATCRKCGFQVPEDSKLSRLGVKRKRFNGHGKAKRRSDDDDEDDDDDMFEPGVMKPDITFFGEGLPRQFFDRLTDHDRDHVDLVIVIGTSMKVAPVSELPNVIPPSVPQIYISRDPIHHINFDITLLGDCDTVVAELCRRANWTLKHKMLDYSMAIDVEPCEGHADRWTVKARSN